MKLRELILLNFRSYRDETRICFDSMTAIVGRNDVGKSTILEALEVFFNNETVKISRDDANIHSGFSEVTIGCVFEDLPAQLVLDRTAQSSLQDDFLLNADGYLEIRKVFKCTSDRPREEVFAYAYHPEDELLHLNQADLKKRIKELGISEEAVDLRSNSSMRKALWEHLSPSFTLRSISLEKAGDAKGYWDAIKKELPTFALFQSDRPSKDEDAEVQDPMKFAVRLAIKSAESKLEEVKAEVSARATDVAKRTLEKLKSMDPQLAQDLKPRFRADPKWDTLFKLSLTGDDEIPINKRGSGVRRLLLLNFFRAEAERRAEEKQCKDIIYAVEEPETSQHPSYQVILIDSLKELADQSNTQVIITSHVPALVARLPLSSIRYIYQSESEARHPVVDHGRREVYNTVANELGVLSHPQRPKLIVGVEGKTDVEFLRTVSALLIAHHTSVLDLSDPAVALLPLGGSLLKDWVDREYLFQLNLPVCVLVDSDGIPESQYGTQVDRINARDDGSFAVTLRKREIENYIHPNAVRRSLGLSDDFIITDESDVPMEVAKRAHEGSESTKRWDELTKDELKEKDRLAKKRLANIAVPAMTYSEFMESDSDGEFRTFLERASRLLQELK